MGPDIGTATRVHLSAITAGPTGYASGCEPAHLRIDDVRKTITDIISRNIYAGPNCWGTVAFLLGITPTLRYVSDVEFSELLSAAKPADAASATCAVLCIWDNSTGMPQQHHAALVIDAATGEAFERTGGESSDSFRYACLESILEDGRTAVFSDCPLVDSFHQPTAGKFGLLVDLSGVPAKATSIFEEALCAFHRTKDLLNDDALRALVTTFESEITHLEDARDLSLSEAMLHLLSDAKLSMLDTQNRFLASRDKSLLKQLRANAILRSFVDDKIERLSEVIRAYRRTCAGASERAPTLSALPTQSTISLTLAI